MGLTGLYNTPPVLVSAAGSAGLPSNETSLASLAKSKGYRTAAVGKWHLGINSLEWGDQEHGPLGHGFDYFYGLPFTLFDSFVTEDSFFTVKQCFNGTELPVILFCLVPLRFYVGRKTFFSMITFVMFLSWFTLEHFCLTRENWWQRSFFIDKMTNSYLQENNVVVEKPVDLTSLSRKLVDKSVGVIREREKDSRPFLLYHSFAHTHTPLRTEDRLVGSSEHGSYGDAVIEMDQGVGRILAAIREVGQEPNTLVYFTSDHGGDQPQLGPLGGFNGIFRGGKGNGALEGGMRVPGIIKWPERIEAGRAVSGVTSLLDLLPTIAHIVGVETLSNRVDGVSLLSTLTDLEPSERLERTVFHFCDSEIFSLRRQMKDGKIYKMILQEPELTQSGGCSGEMCPCYGPTIRKHDTPLLYDINEDPTESQEIDPRSVTYKVVSKVMTKELLAFMEDLNETKMASQFSSYFKILPLPWLQPLLYV